MRIPYSLSLIMCLAILPACIPLSNSQIASTYSSNYSESHAARSSSFLYSGLVHRQISEIVLFPTLEIRNSDTLRYVVLARNGNRIRSNSQAEIFSTRECHELINHGIPLTLHDVKQLIRFIDELPSAVQHDATIVQSAEYLAINGWFELRLQAMDDPDDLLYNLHLQNTYQPINREQDSTAGPLTSVVRQLLRATDSPIHTFVLCDLERDWIADLRALLAASLNRIDVLERKRNSLSLKTAK